MKKDFSDQRRLLVVWALCVAALIVYGIALSGCTMIKKAIDEKRTDKAKSQFDRHPDSAAHSFSFCNFVMLINTISYESIYTTQNTPRRVVATPSFGNSVDKPSTSAGLCIIMSARKDLTGQRFGRLFVLGLEHSRDNILYFRCKCDCGNIKVIAGKSLRKGATLSCGCLAKEVASSRGVHHEANATAEYRIWRAIKYRCLTETCKEYPYYGGRGITICDRWKDSFLNFLADMGRRPTSLHSIERKKVDGHYSPDNCVWATKKEQANNRRSNRKIIFKGKEMNVKQFREMVGITKWELDALLYRKHLTTEQIAAFYEKNSLDNNSSGT